VKRRRGRYWAVASLPGCWRVVGAGTPDLDRDELVAGAVVVAEAIRYALADDIIGFPGRELGDVGV